MKERMSNIGMLVVALLMFLWLITVGRTDLLVVILEMMMMMLVYAIRGTQLVGD
jgi:hypothetical protein